MKHTGKTEDSKGRKFVLTEVEAANAPVRDVKWYGEEMQTQAKLEDPGVGTILVLKKFDFNFPPQDASWKVPGKKDILDHHRKRIEIFLWKDGLELREDIKPLKVVISKKNNQFSIFATCAYKKGVMVPRHVLEGVKPIQEQFDPSRNKV